MAAIFASFFAEQRRLPLQKQLDLFFVQGVKGAVSVDGALHQAAVGELVHMVVDGVAAEREAGGQLLHIGGAPPQIAKNVKPGGVPQQAVGFAHLVLGGGAAADQLHELPPQHAAVDAHLAGGLVKGQVGVRPEEEGVKGVGGFRGGAQVGQLGEKLQLGQGAHCWR